MRVQNNTPTPPRVTPGFDVEAVFKRKDVSLYDCKSAPFSIHGVFFDGALFRRMPAEAAEAVSEGVGIRATYTAGGRVRFRTDSPFVAISVKMPRIMRATHFALTGSSGLDLYADGHYGGSFIPPSYTMQEGYESILDLGEPKMRDIMVELPIFSSVSELLIGLADDATIAPPTPYRHSLPAIFYGSSITQGIAATRPGTCYQALLSRELDLDYINLGFSSCAHGEQSMADYLAALPMSLFFLDYDHNAKSVSALSETHERLFLTVRQAHPDIPIILMSRPKARLTEEEQWRREVIEATYLAARARGDERVYFIDGPALTLLSGDEGTVDGVHPNDLGFASMARALSALIREQGLLD